MAESIEIYKTYKNFVGGAYERSESGRSQETVLKDRHIRVPLSSRKDLRNAVEAALKAQPSWQGQSAYNRGQVIYRIAEMLQGRRQEFIDYLSAEGTSDSEREIDAALDRIVYLAGWADKYQQVLSSVNPVNGPYYVSSAPEPIGVVVLAAPQNDRLVSLVTRLLLALVAGNSVIAIGCSPLQLNLAEVLQSSDVPAGVVNLLSGGDEELVAVAASHKGVGAIDLTADHIDVDETITAAITTNLKRLIQGSGDWYSANSVTPSQLAELSEIKTVWHPLGY